MPEILPDFILADLYPSSLVIFSDDKAAQISSDTITAPISNPTEKIVSTITPKPKEIVKPVIPSKPKNEQFHLGNNGKKITILVNEANAVFLTDASLDFLTKILGACKLNMGDVAVVNIDQQPMYFNDIKKILTPTVCLLFNVVAENIQLPFTIPHYQVQQYANCTFLMAPALSTYYTNDEEAKIEKTKLWVSLKKIFNL